MFIMFTMLKSDVSIIVLVALAISTHFVHSAPYEIGVTVIGDPNGAYTNHDKPKSSSSNGLALRAKTQQIQEQIQVVYDNYCGKVQNYLTFISSVAQQTTPAGRCKTFSDETKASFGIPGTTTVSESNLAAQEKLLDGMTQLEHTLKQKVSVMTGSLKATPQSCQASSSDNPCTIICDQYREPEQQVACAFHATILPNIEQYINLLKSETGKVSTVSPIDILVHSSTSKTNLRYHQVDVNQYAIDEIIVHSEYQKY